MLRFVNIRIFCFWQALGHAAAVRTLVSQQKFRNAENVIRRKQLVKIRLREIERVMVLEQAAQFGINLQAIYKLIARRDGTLLLLIPDTLRIDLCQAYILPSDLRCARTPLFSGQTTVTWSS